MPAYPTSTKSFGPPHQDYTEFVLAGHVNDLQDEVVAIENNLGALPNIGQNLVGSNTTYSTLKARIDAIMAGVRTHTHDGTSGVKLDQANTHQTVDTDVATTSLHHTVGTGANQAASGATLAAHTAATNVHGLASPVVGSTDVQTLTNKNLTSGNTFPTSLATLTGAQVLTNKDLSSPTNSLPPNVPRGLLGYAQSTADTTVANGGTDIAATLATVVGTGRRVKITAVAQPTSNVAGTTVVVSIVVSSVTIQQVNVYIPYVGVGVFATTMVVTLPAAGSYTYSVRVSNPLGNGVVVNAANTSLPSFILVEDIGI